MTIFIQEPFVNYGIANESALPPYSGKMIEYLLAGNGLLLRSHRPELEICIKLYKYNIGNLPHIEPYFRMLLPKVPKSIVEEMLEKASNIDREILFYLGYHSDCWHLHVPPQQATVLRVTSGSPPFDSSYENAIIEVHSHSHYDAFFSQTDDVEETGKFRIFAVLGNLPERPTICTRVGIYNHFNPLVAAQIFEMPERLIDKVEVYHTTYTS
ncbi:hypothetical protein WA1_49050 [Scytonema hofmannii PCC 7110]|uniref:JAB domain-containing protein n=1 Tax=Scytonema hofmannii PCC 7110 TaxID=128403 RepID=A0A139WQI6_9CYAN|nr:Mov34/MPN/PAD-1 family protein [Scytonema hofmannii]KYC34690.1 hypothetical protein WA1_49050 [Scytonema hofmannii PCC 7110]